MVATETDEQKSTVFVTRFESSADGIKSTTSKIADVEGVLIEEVLSEPEQEQVSPQRDVIIEEVIDEGEQFVENIQKSSLCHLAERIYKLTISVFYTKQQLLLSYLL